MKSISVATVISILFIGGCSGISNIEMNRTFNYDSLHTVGIYLHPSDDSKYDQELLNLIRLKFSSLGYEIKNLSPIRNKYFRDTVSFIGHQETTRLLFNHQGKDCDAIAIVKPDWKSVIRTLETKQGDNYILLLTKLSLEFTMWAKKDTTLLISRKIDRLEDVYDDKKKFRILGVTEHVLMQRVLTDILDGFPICKTEVPPAHHVIPIVMFVDLAYLDYYKTSWDHRLKQRMIFVNDVYKRYFDTEFEIADFRTWEPANDTSVEASLDDLIKKTKDAKNVFIVGIMVNDKLIHKWREGSEAGMAEFFSKRFIACNLTHLPGMEEWNSIEESAVIIHELGHVFGACHTYDYSSTMYPSTSILSFEFDSLNSEIIKYARDNFDKLDRGQLLKENINRLLNAYSTHASAKTMFVPQVYSIIQDIKKFETGNDSIQIADISQTVSDSAFQHTLIGRFYSKQKQWKNAEEHFLRAIEINPDFVEPYFYLSAVYEETDEQGKAKDYSKIGREKLNRNEEN